jgi:hypothetical protein
MVGKRAIGVGLDKEHYAWNSDSCIIRTINHKISAHQWIGGKHENGKKDY